MKIVQRTVFQQSYLTGHRGEQYEGSITQVQSSKGRAIANPFGVGLASDALSGYQLAILGSLGLSKIG
jgi:hypothetical protein